jgi:hypothetical protein
VCAVRRTAYRERQPGAGCVRARLPRREVLGWIATTAGISGEMIRARMIECIA